MLHVVAHTCDLMAIIDSVEALMVATETKTHRSRATIAKFNLRFDRVPALGNVRRRSSKFKVININHQKELESSVEED